MTDVDPFRFMVPVSVLDVLRPERNLLCDLLASLTAADWSRPTECPAWTIRGLALHVLGDDLSLLARQRDAEVPSLLTEISLPEWESAPANVLDRFNERWVHAATFLSPALVVELLRTTGVWTSAYYDTVDPDSRGEPVLLFAPGPAPYWVIAAREYVERWVHHLQIRRALGLGAGPLDDPVLRDRAYEVLATAFARLVALVDPPPAAEVVVGFGEQSWTYGHDGSAGWTARRGRADAPVVAASIDARVATTVLSRGLSQPETVAAITVTGDATLGASLRDAMAAVMSASHPDR